MTTPTPTPPLDWLVVADESLPPEGGPTPPPTFASRVGRGFLLALLGFAGLVTVGPFVALVLVVVVLVLVALWKAATR